VTWESFLPWSALAAFLVAGGAQLAARWAGADPRWAELARRAYAAGTGILAGSLALLLLYFLLGELSIEYVFTYTRVDYPWYYRMSGLWGGQDGTLLMWATFIALAGLWLVRMARRGAASAADPEAVRRAADHIRLVVCGILVVFSWVLITAGVFDATSDYLLTFKPQGNGLQPVLLTPFMIIHPPLQFVAYALTALLFAGGLVNVVTGDRHWAAIVRPWARMAFLFSTFGLGLGGLWAYYVLNFGGFWAWDPVETANLISWFPITILLHTLLWYDKGRFSTAAPLFALLTLPTALFATVATRTGLWVSVHAFTDPSTNFAVDPLQRLLNILDTSGLLGVLTGLFFVSLVVPVAAVALGRARAWSEPARSRAQAAILAASTLAAVALLFAPMQSLGMAFQVFLAVSLGRSALVGLLIVVGAVVAWAALAGPEPPQATTQAAAGAFERRVNARTIFAAGVVLLGLAFLVTFLLDILSVNGYTREPYDDRAPLVATPVLLTMGMFFLLPWLGPRRGLMAAGGALALGVGAALAVPAYWQLGLVLPALALAGVGALRRAAKESGDANA
jgi:cytochrome c-type biogenesis protein CcmF